MLQPSTSRRPAIIAAGIATFVVVGTAAALGGVGAAPAPAPAAAFVNAAAPQDQIQYVVTPTAAPQQIVVVHQTVGGGDDAGEGQGGDDH